MAIPKRMRNGWGLRLPLLWSLTGISVYSCDNGSVAESESRQGVTVAIRGRVVDVSLAEGTETAGRFSGVSVTIVRTSTSGQTDPMGPAVQVDSQNSFAIPSVTLEPWNETYELLITDSSGRYRERSLAVFAVSGGVLDYGDIALTPTETQNITQVRGIVVDASTGTPIPKVQLKFTSEEATLETVSDSEGKFRIESVEVQGYSLALDANAVKTESAPLGYVSNNVSVALNASTDNNLGTLLLTPRRHEGEVTLVLSAPLTIADDGHPTSECLKRLPTQKSNASVRGAGHLFMPPPDVDVNGAYGVQNLRWGAEGLTRPDGYGFGTPFWPVFLGMRSGSSGTVVVPIGNKYAPASGGGTYAEELYSVGSPARVVADARVFDFADSRVETMTLPKRSPLAEPPRDLAYFYESLGTRRFPVAVGLFSASTICFERAELTVYQGEAMIGRFDYSRNSEIRQSGELTEWAPILIEYGFTDAMTAAVTSDATDALTYINVIPFAAVDLGRDSMLQAYEQPAGVQPDARALENPGWDPVPDSLWYGAAGSSLALLLGKSGDASGVWMLDAGNGPLRANTLLAGTDPRLPAGAAMLAAAVTRLGSGNDLAALAYSANGKNYIQELLRDAQPLTFPCATPTCLAYVDGQLVVGTDVGLKMANCQADTSNSHWLPSLVQSAQSKFGMVRTVTPGTNAQGYPLLIVGTEHGGLWLGDPGGGKGWSRVQSIPEDATVVAVTQYENQTYVVTETTVYRLRGAEATKMAEFGADGLPKSRVSGETGKDTLLINSSIVAHNKRLFVGTNAGVVEMDLRAQEICAEDPNSAYCTTLARRLTPGIPPLRVNGFVTVAGRIYALSQRGLLELLGPGMSLSGSGSTDGSISGLGGIGTSAPNGGSSDPFEPSLTPQLPSGQAGAGSRPLSAPSAGTSGAPKLPPNYGGVAGALVSPAPPLGPASGAPGRPPDLLDATGGVPNRPSAPLAGAGPKPPL